MKKLSTLLLLCLALGSRTFAGIFTSATLTSTAVLVTAQTSPSAPFLVSYNISNPNSAIVYVQFFNAATSGAVTVGSTAPLFWVAVPATNGVIDTALVTPIPFSLGIVIACTTTPTGSTAPSSADPISIVYK